MLVKCFWLLKISKDDLLKDDFVIQLGVRPVRIHIMNKLAGISFDEAFTAKKEVMRENVIIHFIG